jgi:hypothetical protein
MSTAKPDDSPQPAASGWGSPLLAHVALVALVIFSIAQALQIFAPMIRANSREQMVYMAYPNPMNNLQDIQKHLDAGWRITHMHSGISATATPLQGGAVYNKDWFVVTVYVFER